PAVPGDHADGPLRRPGRRGQGDLLLRPFPVELDAGVAGKQGRAEAFDDEAAEDRVELYADRCRLRARQTPGLDPATGIVTLEQGLAVKGDGLLQGTADAAQHLLGRAEGEGEGAGVLPLDDPAGHVVAPQARVALREHGLDLAQRRLLTITARRTAGGAGHEDPRRLKQQRRLERCHGSTQRRTTPRAWATGKLMMFRPGMPKTAKTPWRGVVCASRSCTLVPPIALASLTRSLFTTVSRSD